MWFKSALFASCLLALMHLGAAAESRHAVKALGFPTLLARQDDSPPSKGNNTEGAGAGAGTLPPSTTTLFTPPAQFPTTLSMPDHSEPTPSFDRSSFSSIISTPTERPTFVSTPVIPEPESSSSSLPSFESSGLVSTPSAVPTPSDVPTLSSQIEVSTPIEISTPVEASTPVEITTPVETLPPTFTPTSTPTPTSSAVPTLKTSDIEISTPTPDVPTSSTVEILTSKASESPVETPSPTPDFPTSSTAEILTSKASEPPAETPSPTPDVPTSSTVEILTSKASESLVETPSPTPDVPTSSTVEILTSKASEPPVETPTSSPISIPTRTPSPSSDEPGVPTSSPPTVSTPISVPTPSERETEIPPALSPTSSQGPFSTSKASVPTLTPEPEVSSQTSAPLPSSTLEADSSVVLPPPQSSSPESVSRPGTAVLPPISSSAESSAFPTPSEVLTTPMPTLAPTSTPILTTKPTTVISVSSSLSSSRVFSSQMPISNIPSGVFSSQAPTSYVPSGIPTSEGLSTSSQSHAPSISQSVPTSLPASSNIPGNIQTPQVPGTTNTNSGLLTPSATSVLSSARPGSSILVSGSSSVAGVPSSSDGVSSTNSVLSSALFATGPLSTLSLHPTAPSSSSPLVSSNVPFLPSESLNSLSSTRKAFPSSSIDIDAFVSSLLASTASGSIGRPLSSRPHPTSVSSGQIKSSLFGIPTTFSASETISVYPSSIVTSSRTASSFFTLSPSVIATFSTVVTVSSSALDPSRINFSLFTPTTAEAINQASASDFDAIPTSEASLTTIANSNFTLAIPSGSSTAPISLSDINVMSTMNRLEPISTLIESALPTNTGASKMQEAEKSTSAEASSAMSGGGLASSPTDSTTILETPAISESASGSSIDSSGASTPNTTDSDASNPTSRPDTTEDPEYRTDTTPSQTPVESAKETEASSPPPLTTSQTAGIAVAGTTGLLIAVVAAIFLARRVHAAHGRRKSTGSVYPKIAYLYDSNTRGGNGDAEALIAGATDPKPQDGKLQSANPRHSTSNVNHSGASNPFSDPANTRDSANSLPAPADSATALAAAVAGYQKSVRHTKYPSNGTNPFRGLVIPSPRINPFSPDDVGKRSSMTETRGQYACLAPNPNPNPAAAYYPPVSPYGPAPAPYGRPPSSNSSNTADSDPFADPFEHDILLQVDARTETPDSVTVFASPRTPRTPFRDRTPVGPKLPINVNPKFNGSPELLSPIARQFIARPQQITITRKAGGTPRTPPTPSNYSPENSPPTPAHRGWEAIKRVSGRRFSRESSVPAPLNVPVANAAASASVMSRPALGLGLGRKKIPLPANPRPVRPANVTVEVPHRASRAARLVVPGADGEEVSSDPVIRQKRSGELVFADPKLVGKEAF